MHQTSINKIIYIYIYIHNLDLQIDMYDRYNNNTHNFRPTFPTTPKLNLGSMLLFFNFRFEPTLLGLFNCNIFI